MSVLTDCLESVYRVGQRWSYQARPHETASILVVVRVDRHPVLGVIVHVSVTGLSIRNPSASSGIAEEVAHLPFSEAAIDGSVTGLLEENPILPDFLEGYMQWRDAFDRGKAGVFQISVAEAIDRLENSLNT
jgi:hypothetical protein